jgi:hypothetical protein
LSHCFRIITRNICSSNFVVYSYVIFVRTLINNSHNKTIKCINVKITLVNCLVLLCDIFINART